MTLESVLTTAFYWIVAHKWWLIALFPIAIIVIVLRALNPR